MVVIPKISDPSADASVRALLPGAQRVVEVCAGVQSGETVVIVTDNERPPDVAAALAQATATLGATALIITMDALPSGTEPPPPVTAAMASADAILAATSGALYHTQAVQVAAEAGARFLALTAYTKDVLVRGGVFADFPRLESRAIRLAERLTVAQAATVTAPGGTNLTVRLDNRIAVPITGMARYRGERSGCPDIEAFIAPIETSAEGKVVADASASVVGVLAEPLSLTLRGGRAVSVEGGSAAEIIRESLERAGTSNAYILAELAFGLNPQGLIRGVIVEDEGVGGTGHVALGSNVFFGGKSSAPVHLDFVYTKPTLMLDGETVIKDGILCEALLS